MANRMDRSHNNLRLIWELIGSIVMTFLVLGLPLIAAFIVSPYMGFAMLFVYILEIYRRIKYSVGDNS